jgi:hypothetical protein
VNYSDGNEARLGDHVAISGKHRGVVVACLDRNEYSPDHPREQWAYLGKGVMVNTDFGGLVHYADSTLEHMVLVSRANYP